MSALDRHDHASLCRKPAPDSWSLGQVYSHLLLTTGSIVDQSIPIALEDCAKNTDKNIIFVGRLILLFGFPPVRIRTPKGVNPEPPAPESVEQLRRDFETVVKKIEELAKRVDSAACSGKTKHPRIGYLDARQWLRFIEVHWSHHLRQKGRIEKALKSSSQESAR